MPRPTTSKRERQQQDRLEEASLFDADISATAEAANARTVVIQLHDRVGRALQEQGAAEVWLSDVARGADCAAAPTGGFAVTASAVLLVATVANKHGVFLSHTDGKISFIVTEAAAKTFFVNVRRPGDFRIQTFNLTFV
jgi:hypothetical protein